MSFWTDELTAEDFSTREPGVVWKRTLVRNLASLRQHRLPVFESVSQLAEIAPDSTCETMSEEARVVAAFAAIQELRLNGHAVALAGVGDGVILHALAKFPPTFTLGRQQGIDLIEPDPARLLAALASVDLTGPRGPIEQPRFAWYVGPAWEEQLGDDLLAMPTKIPPQRAIRGGEAERTEIEDGLSRILDRVRAATADRAAHNASVDAARDDAELLAVFSAHPPRKPRVLLITSQFTSVLQYSTYDSADAFRQLGWDTRVVTELEPWHLMAKPAIVAAIAEFEPDLVFQIDHLRYELGDTIPPNLPFVCWIQDHLINLTNAIAGASIGGRDFVLTGGVYRYAGRYGYPREQCIDMPKVSRPPVLPTRWSHEREDLLYVSHWSSSPEAIIVETCNRVRDFGGVGAEALMRACTTELTRVYAAGGSMRSDLEVRGLVRRVFARTGECLRPESEQFFVDVLFQRLNNAFYRQQSLLWAGHIADEFGLKLGIYGHGWEKHPELGRFARGVVKYGPDLEALTRESKILLQLEPYACYTHQRMLDCVLTGGFALIRDHVLNTLPIRVRKFLDAHVPACVNDVATARTYLSQRESVAFDEIIGESEIITDLGDLVEVVRGWQRAGTIGDGDEALPHLNSINFDSFETLRERVRAYIDDPAARAQISGDQRASVLGRLTYKSAIGRATQTIFQRLRATLAPRQSDALRRAEAA